MLALFLSVSGGLPGPLGKQRTRGVLNAGSAEDMQRLRSLPLCVQRYFSAPSAAPRSWVHARPTSASISAAGLTPDTRETSRPPRKSASVGIDMMRKRSPSSGTASVLTLITSARPAMLRAAVSSSGAIIRHGPHHGAQKSTTTGTGACWTMVSNAAASAASTGSAGGDSDAWQFPQRIARSSVANRRRFVLPHDGQRASTP